MIMISPLPGVEVRNAEFMLNNGLAIYATKTLPLSEALYLFYRKRKQMLEDSLRKEAKPDATTVLWNFLCAHHFR